MIVGMVKVHIIFENAPAGRREDFGMAQFQVCPRIGEVLHDMDPDEVHTAVVVHAVAHRRGLQPITLFVRPFDAANR